MKTPKFWETSPWKTGAELRELDEREYATLMEAVINDAESQMVEPAGQSIRHLEQALRRRMGPEHGPPLHCWRAQGHPSRHAHLAARGRTDLHMTLMGGTADELNAPGAFSSSPRLLAAGT